MILQMVGVALGLLYLYLEYKANIWLWVVGIIMPIVHGTLYFRSGLYADCAMQVYYAQKNALDYNTNNSATTYSSIANSEEL